MKVVCIKIPPTFVNIKLEVNEIYEAFMDIGTRNGVFNSYWYVVDELGNVIPCEFEVKKYFITLAEFRQKKLEELGI